MSRLCEIEFKKKARSIWRAFSVLNLDCRLTVRRLAITAATPVRLVGIVAGTI